MKTKAKQTTKRAKARPAPRKKRSDRGLNEDEQGRVTNNDEDDDEEGRPITRGPENSDIDEEDEEKERKDDRDSDDVAEKKTRKRMDYSNDEY